MSESEALLFEKGEGKRILILAGRLGRHDGRWPLASWLDRLESRGFQIQLLCLSRGNVLTEDLRVLDLPALGNRWSRGWAVRSLWSEEGLRRPDLIHSVHDEMSESALLIAEAWKLPYVQTAADFRTLERGLRLSRRWCRRLIAIRPDLAVGLIEQLCVPESRVEVIAPGIALPDEAGRERMEDRLPVIGASGPFDDPSGLFVFLEAAHRILEAGRDAEFVIAGPGAGQAELRRHAQNLRITERVTVADFPSVGADYWSVMDIYCQPSVTSNSGVPLLQAMAHAVPCVATEVPGLRGLIEPGQSGIVVPSADPRALERAIVGLLDRPDAARRLGQNARDRVRLLFDPEAEVDRLARLYVEILRPEVASA